MLKAMNPYPFSLVDYTKTDTLADKTILLQRPMAESCHSYADNARRFIPGGELETAINAAIAAGVPLLLSGEAGTGKTQVAYYVAYKLGLEPVFHFQTKSTSVAKDLLYEFDAVRYFHDAQAGQANLNKASYVEPRPLWQAIAAKAPRVLLIDEIDKASRDFPNDLLHELEKMEFTIAEIGKTYAAPKQKRPLVFITSNSERRLPDAFLRRCLYHPIRFNPGLLKQIVDSRQEDFAPLSPGFIQLALERFLALRGRELRKPPATAELLLWLRVLAIASGTYPERLDTDLSKLPHLGALLKDHQDMEELRG
jgi:MoxR-like ATPase